MFLIQDGNRLPLQSAMAGATVWAVMEQWTPGDLLVLRVSEKRARGGSLRDLDGSHIRSGIVEAVSWR